MGKIAWVLAVISGILGLYLLNLGTSFIDAPLFLMDIESWIIGISGIFLIVGAVNNVRAANP